jgi:hypothetical protein
VKSVRACERRRVEVVSSRDSVSHCERVRRLRRIPKRSVMRAATRCRVSPTVVETETLQDHLERKGFACGDLRGEDAVTGVAVPELDRLPLLIPLAFPGDVCPLAVDTALGVRTDEGLVRTG